MKEAQAPHGASDDGEAVDAFLRTVENQDRAAALAVLRQRPSLRETSLHVAAVLGDADAARRILAESPEGIAERAGPSPAEPLLWLCYSPFHGESAERDAGLLRTAKALLDAGASPDACDDRHGVPALYAVTGFHNAPAIARLLLEAGASPTDGESVFHAAERFHTEALELLREYGVDLDHTGEWGNTPLYFLLRYWDVAEVESVRKGFEWLLAHGADPNVRCGREQETALHAAARRGQHPAIVRMLLDHGADVHARRGDGRSAWTLASRAGFTDVAALLEEAGAVREPLSAADVLLAACGRGDAEAARSLATAETRAALQPEDLRMLAEAAGNGRAAIVDACLAAGWPVDAPGDDGASASHHAAIRGDVAMVRTLLRFSPDLSRRDPQHDATPFGWACFGADHVAQPGGDYEGTVRALLEAGSRLEAGVATTEHDGVRAVLGEFRRQAG